MSDEKHPPSKREYPAAYEKIVPIALSIIALAIIALLIIIFIVALSGVSGAG